MFFKKKKKKKVCAVGIDGVPYTLIKRFMEDGTMPALKEISQKGFLHKMKVTLPEISSVSWSSFMTGTNPGTHGIFGFFDLKPGTYDLCFPSFKDLKVATFWDKLGEKGKKSIVINQPSTYPARKINGILISGFVAIDMAKAISPPTYRSKLEALGYKIDIDTQRGRNDHDYLIKELDETLNSRGKAVDYLWENEEWDYFQVVITGTDRINHFLWDALDNREHKYHSVFLDYYSKIDKFINKIYERFNNTTGEEGKGFFLLSDHGFTGIKREVYINSWLAEKGYLSYETPSPESVKSITRDTKAFALDPSRIYINIKGKFPKGCVALEDVPRVKEELKEKLEGLRHEGNKVIQKVLDRTEIYSGPMTNNGPDLIALSYHGYDLKGSVRQKEVFGHSGLQGMHTWDDAFFLANNRIKDDLNITELSDIIIESFE